MVKYSYQTINIIMNKLFNFVKTALSQLCIILFSPIKILMRLPKAISFALLTLILLMSRSTLNATSFMSQSGLCSAPEYFNPIECASYNSLAILNWFLVGINATSLLVSFIAFIVFVIVFVLDFFKKDVARIIRVTFTIFLVTTLLQVFSAGVFYYTGDYTKENISTAAQLKDALKASEVSK